MGKLEAIDQVQSAEAEAREKIEKANAAKIAKIQKAQDESNEILNKAAEDARAIKEGALKSVHERIAKDSRKRLDDAKKKAASIEESALSAQDIKKAAEKIVDKLVGGA